MVLLGTHIYQIVLLKDLIDAGDGTLGIEALVIGNILRSRHMLPGQFTPSV